MHPSLRLSLLFLILFIFVTGCITETPPSLVAPASSGNAKQTLDTPTPSPTLDPPTATPSPVPPTATPFPTSTETQIPSTTPAPAITMILFTGAIVPGRCVQAAIDEQGTADYLYKDVRELVSSADLAVGTLNAALSDYPPHTGCIKTFVLVGSSNNADAMANAGFDMVSVATNHIKNCGLSTCGDRAFLDTMDNLARVGILPVGAGNNIQEAMQPVVVEKKWCPFWICLFGRN